MIRLRDFVETDIDELVKLANNANVSKFLSSRFPYPYSTKDAEWWFATGSKIGFTQVIDIKGNFVGIIGITQGEYEHAHCAELGYWIGEKYWGQGITTKAVKLMTNSIFANTKTERLFAPVFSTNLASMKVLTKCGYQLEAVLKNAICKNGQYFDEHIYSILSTEHE